MQDQIYDEINPFKINLISLKVRRTQTLRQETMGSPNPENNQPMDLCRLFHHTLYSIARCRPNISQQGNRIDTGES